MIAIPIDLLNDMIQHAREHSPVEACGLLGGVDNTIQKSYRLSNVDASREHFSLDPKEHFAAVKDARSLGIEILAVYHSHPETPARMSDEDLRLAFAPRFRYVIISLIDPDQPDVRCFSVIDGRPVEEQVKIQELQK
ncbi:MAG: M67 family metallopeptidase [Armatimonadota bacterium]